MDARPGGQLAALAPLPAVDDDGLLLPPGELFAPEELLSPEDEPSDDDPLPEDAPSEDPVDAEPPELSDVAPLFRLSVR